MKVCKLTIMLKHVVNTVKYREHIFWSPETLLLFCFLGHSKYKQNQY